MTRAEFAAIIARGLGLTQKENAVFRDVNTNDWFCSYVATAYAYGIIKGVSENEFNMIITQINKVALASFFASRKKKNSGMYSITFYCILLSFIVNAIIAILVGINKFQIGFIIPLIIISNASFLFVMIYIYRKRITHLSKEDNFLKRYMNKHLKEINEKYKKDQIDWEWSYEPFKKEIMIKFN
jgi:hypothetical protein